MKSIVVFSDGTGNSTAKFFKTNVYRLYQAVDTTDPSSESANTHQVVTYDSGVGTSSFKPLALLGGAFGVGLKRNVLDLYRFICRHYEKGDRIYAFGFSRGAFTIRVLIGLVTQMGVVKAEDKAVLDALTADAYREFRRCFRLSGNRVVVDQETPRAKNRRPSGVPDSDVDAKSSGVVQAERMLLAHRITAEDGLEIPADMRTPISGTYPSWRRRARAMFTWTGFDRPLSEWRDAATNRLRCWS